MGNPEWFRLPADYIVAWKKKISNVFRILYTNCVNILWKQKGYCFCSSPLPVTFPLKLIIYSHIHLPLFLQIPANAVIRLRKVGPILPDFLRRIRL